MDSCDDEERKSIKLIIDLIPSVLDTLKQHNQVDAFIKFNKLLAGNKIPMTNIAYLLFIDVVEWFSNENTHQMRYSDEVKQFWRIGLKLFKGKFLRFMGGWKNQGQNANGCTKPEDSVINFAVPHRNSLEDTGLGAKLKYVKPAILQEMIELVSNSDPQQLKTFKLCVDGKKINVGAQNQNFGDVNLWGFEGSPTLSERVENLEQDQNIVKRLSDILMQIEERYIEELQRTPKTLQDKFSEVGRDIIHIMSKRLMALRKVKQSKIMTLEKLKAACTNDFMKNKYSYAMSAIKTYIYRINLCIERLLRSVDI